jgi:hypothetical protein
MNSCGSTNIDTKLKRSKNLDKCDEILFTETQEEDKEVNQTLSSFNANDIIRVPKTTFFICPRNSNNYLIDNNSSRFKPRYVSFISFIN